MFVGTTRPHVSWIWPEIGREWPDLGKSCLGVRVSRPLWPLVSLKLRDPYLWRKQGCPVRRPFCIGTPIARGGGFLAGALVWVSSPLRVFDGGLPLLGASGQDRLCNANHSGPWSPHGFGAPIHGANRVARSVLPFARKLLPTQRRLLLPWRNDVERPAAAFALPARHTITQHQVALRRRRRSWREPSR